jgi:hypothetical protein
MGGLETLLRKIILYIYIDTPSADNGAAPVPEPATIAGFGKRYFKRR